MTIYDKFSKKAVWLRLIYKFILHKLWDHFVLLNRRTLCKIKFSIGMWMKSLFTSTKVQIRVIYVYFCPYPHYLLRTSMLFWSLQAWRCFRSKIQGGIFKYATFFKRVLIDSWRSFKFGSGQKNRNKADSLFVKMNINFQNSCLIQCLIAFLYAFRCFRLLTNENSIIMCFFFLSHPATSNHFVLFVFHACFKGDIFANSRT